MSTQTNNPPFPPQSSTLSPIHTHPLSLEQEEADSVVGQGRPLRSPWWGALLPVPDEQHSRQPCAIDRIKNEDGAGREDTRNLSNRCLQIAYMFQCIDKSPRQQRQSTYWAE